eukprot:5798_1
MQHYSKKQKLNNHTPKLIAHQYQTTQRFSDQIPQMSKISLTTNINTNNNQLTTKDGRILKFELHPTKTNTQVINLADSSVESISTSPSDSNSSVESVSSDLYDMDHKGYLVFVQGLTIKNKYKLVKQLGKGTFSRVFECHIIKDENDKSKHEKCAIKVIRNVYKYQVAAEMELEILKKIRDNDPEDKSCCIRLLKNHQYRGHPVFVFPLLGKSIYSFMVSNQFKPFCYQDVVHLMYQICRGVEYVHSISIIITDLKPENIVLVNDEIDYNKPIDRQMYCSPVSTKIKLIDFGSAVIHKKK